MANQTPPGFTTPDDLAANTFWTTLNEDYDFPSHFGGLDAESIQIHDFLGAQIQDYLTTLHEMVAGGKSLTTVETNAEAVFNTFLAERRAWLRETVLPCPACRTATVRNQKVDRRRQESAEGRLRDARDLGWELYRNLLENVATFRLDAEAYFAARDKLLAEMDQTLEIFEATYIDATRRLAMLRDGQMAYLCPVHATVYAKMVEPVTAHLAALDATDSEGETTYQN